MSFMFRNFEIIIDYYYSSLLVLLLHDHVSKYDSFYIYFLISCSLLNLKTLTFLKNLL